MSYHTISIIISTEDEKEKDFLRINLKSEFPELKTRKINHPFKGYVAQIDLRTSDDFDEDTFETYLTKSSTEFPTLKLALVEVDCFGGRCASNGKVIENGQIIQDEPYHHISHVKLLKAVNDKYQAWHFEPFTREFFEKKGGIWGEIRGMSMVAIAIGIYTGYKDKSGYRCDMTQNEMILHKNDKFYLYLMEPQPNCIKILGSILDDSEETLNEIKEIIADEISYADSYVFLDLIEKEEFIKFDHTGEEGMLESFYRHKAFNERPLIPADPAPESSVTPTSTPRTPTPTRPSQKKKEAGTSWFKRMFGKK